MKKFEYTPPEQPRELILKLGQKITDRIGHTVTAEDPEYYGLEALVTAHKMCILLYEIFRQTKTRLQSLAFSEKRKGDE